MSRSVAYAALAAAGALGALARDALDRAVARRYGHVSVPLGTLTVNLLGSFALGVLLGLGPRVPDELALVGGVGFLGAFTTFSTFAVQTVRLRRGEAVAYVLLSVLGCTAAALAGLRL